MHFRLAVWLDELNGGSTYGAGWTCILVWLDELNGGSTYGAGWTCVFV